MQTLIPDAPGIVKTYDPSLVDSLDEVGGEVIVEVIRDDAFGRPQVIRRAVSHNLIVNTGKRQCWRIMSGLNTDVFDQGRVGTSAAAVASNQTNVLSPVTGTLQTVDSRSLEAGTRTHNWIWSYPSGGGSKSATGIVEAVILNQNTSPGGSAMMRSVFVAVNKATTDKLKITYRARVA